MERYHMFKLGLAVLFCVSYCIRPMLVSGLRSSSLVTNQTLKPEDYNVFYQGVDGTPGVDFPILSFIPKTTFNCDGIESGYYADLDTDCQVFHICEEGKKISFLCPNGTIFEQEDLICEWWYKVNCTNAPNLYQESAEFLREDSARRKLSRRISFDGQERNHGAIMRIEESASVSAQQNGKPYRVSSSRDGRTREPIGNVDTSRSISRNVNNNIIQSVTDKNLQKVRKTDIGVDAINYINNENRGNRISKVGFGDKQVYTRSTTPSTLGGSASNLDEISSRNQPSNNRGNVKFSSSFGSKTESSGSTLKHNTDDYNLVFPTHKSEIVYQPSPTTITDTVKIDSSKVELGRPKQKGAVGLTRNDIINKKLEPSSESDELQFQETAAFIPNSYNSLQSSSRKFHSHPNHRPTYSDLKRPDFSSTKFINGINSVTPQYITTQSINSGKPFIGSTVGANVFNKNSGRTHQAGISSTIPYYTTEKSTFSKEPDVFSTYQSFIDQSEQSTPQPELSVIKTEQPPDSSTFRTFSNNFEGVSSTSQPNFASTIHSIDTSVYSTVNNNNEEIPSTISEFTSTFSPLSEGRTIRPIDSATVYGSFSRPTTAATPTSGAEVKFGKDVNKISIQLTKSLAGEPPKKSKPLLATDGFVRITAGLSQPVFGSSSVNLGIGAGRGGTLPPSLQTGRGIINNPASSGNSGGGAIVSTVIPNVPDGTSFSSAAAITNVKEGSTFVPLATSQNGYTSFQSTTSRPSILETGSTINYLENNRVPLPTSANSQADLSSSINSNVNDEFVPTLNNTVSTAPPNIQLSSGLTGIAGSTVGSTTIGGVGGTAAPSIKESTWIKGTRYGNEIGSTLGSTGSSRTPVQNALPGFTGGIVNGNGGAVFTTVVSGSVVGGAEYDSTIEPDIYINEYSKSTVSPSMKNSYDHSTVRSVTTGVNAQVPDLFIPETQPARTNNVTDTHLNSFRSNFYPTQGNIKYGNKFNPSITTGSPDIPESTPSYGTTKFAANNDEVISSSLNNNLPASPPSVEISLSQNDLRSTLSPVNEIPTYGTTEKGNSIVTGSSTTSIPFGQSAATTSSGFYVTRNSIYGSTTPAPFGHSTATSPRYQSSTPLVNLSPNVEGGSVTLPDITLTPPDIQTTIGGDSLIRSETRHPRPFQRSSNTIDDGTRTKSDSVTPTYLTYKISSARPFELPKDKVTPAPTIPTPFTTARSVQENVDNMISALEEIVDNQDYSSETPRPGLIVPPSVGPQTLHTLAQYFANALDGIVAEREKETGEELDNESKEKLTSLLTQMTMYRYNQLFKSSGASGDVEETTTVEPDEELHVNDSNNLVESPQLRQLAKNFSLALSSYLNDPDAFRKELETYRPTDPPPRADDNTEFPVGEEELLNFSDADSKSSLPPLFPTPPSPAPTWGFIVASKTEDFDGKNSLNPDLHAADTQSFVPGFNSLSASTGKGFDKDGAGAKTELPIDHWTTSPGVTKLWQSALSVNPAAVNENFGSTRPYSHSTEPYLESTTSQSPLDLPESEIHYDLRALPKLSLNSTQVHGILIDFVNTTKTDDTNRLQRLLRKLNTTEDEFIHRMKEIESNPLTKRLILLLISECGANVTKDLQDDPLHNISEILDSSGSDSAVASYQESRTVNSNIPELVDPSLKEEDQDTRALQLLNSLYSIASKFGK